MLGQADGLINWGRTKEFFVAKKQCHEVDEKLRSNEGLDDWAES